MKASFIVQGRTEAELEKAAQQVLAAFASGLWDYAIQAHPLQEAFGDPVPALWTGDVRAWSLDDERPDAARIQGEAG